MIGWILFGVYLFGILVCVAGQMWDDPDATACAEGFMLGLFWPLFAVVGGFWGICWVAIRLIKAVSRQ